MLISPSLHRTMLRLTGAVRVRYAGGEFEAHFDEPTQDADYGEHAIESTEPRLTARTIDVEALAKDTPIEFIDEHGRQRSFKVERNDADGRGESRVILSL